MLGSALLKLSCWLLGPQATSHQTIVLPPAPACQLHETLPQVLLPVMPLLKGELTAEDTKQRLAAVDLVAKVGECNAVLFYGLN